MKKILLLLSIILLLTGCQNSQKSETPETPQKESVNMEFYKTYEDNGISFELIDMIVDKEIYPANTNDEYDYIYFDEDTEYEMLNIVVRVINKSQQKLQADSFFNARLISQLSAEKMECYIESQSFNSLKKNILIKDGESALLHFNVTIDSNQKENNFKLSFDMEDKKYVCSFVVKDFKNQKQTIELNKVLEIKNELSMKFDDLGVFNQVLPDDTSGEYTYYELEDKNNLFLYGSCDFENKSGHDMKLADLPSLRVQSQVMNLFHIAKQTKNKRDFNDNEDAVIKKGEKCRIFYYIELPKDVFFNDIYKNKQKIEVNYKTERYLLKIP